MTVIALLASTAALVALVGGALGYRALLRRRVARALAIDTPNGIDEERFVRIGGIDQWVQIRGEDRDNPVLLVLHGGPGSPYAIFTPLLRSWEKHFTVVQWDRRGAGKTLRRNGRAGCGELTFAGMVDDAVEVTEFLLRHLDKEKVIVLAGSMGTLVGVPLVQRRPDLFAAYVGTDNYVDMLRNEAVSYQSALERASAAGNAKAVAALERIGADPTRWDLRAWGVKMRWAMATDPVTPDAATKLIFPLVLTAPFYSLRDVLAVGSGFEYTKREMFTQFMAYDARRFGTRFEVPFFLLQADRDVLTVTGLAEEYFAEVEAPTKALALIEDASHFCAFTRPERFLAALLTHVRPVAAPA
ncbi:alpha/beta hydrolase [Micromonospora sp. NPDC049559]|uniref:alpha/beta fold hydrolase n=1 Tax=Micromonospora sp. NPDC049559 TaxID=3155923 RepID=UPI0034199979